MNQNTSFDDILNLTREISQNELAPRAGEIDETGKWPEESIRKLQDSGLGGLVIPKEFGGKGHGLLSVAKVCEILGKACASTAMCFGMHLVGSAVLAAKATSDQQKQYLKPIAEGQHLTTLSLSEPGTGANFYIPQAELTNDDSGDFIFNGTKSFVTNGGYADSYVMSAVIPNPSTPVGQFSCVVIENQSKGMKWKEAWKGMGMKGNSSRAVELNNVPVPAENLLGEQGDEIWYVFEVIAPYFIMAMAGTYLGIATAALDEAIQHLKKRTHSHSGTSLAHEPILQNKLGSLWAEVERTRQLIYSAAVKGDTANKADSSVLLSIFSAKAEVAECVENVVNDVMTLMGGIAYADNGNIARHLRDARAAHIMAPTTAMLRMWTGRALLDLPLLGD